MWLYHLAKPLLRLGQTKPSPLDGNSLKKILIIRPEKLGDVFVSLPLCDAIRERFPRIMLYLLASPKSIALVNDDPRFEHVFMYRKKMTVDLREILRMRRERFDCVIDLVSDDSVTSLLLSQLCSRGKPRIGVGKKVFRRYYDFNFEYRTDSPGHVIDNTLRVVEAFGIDSRAVSGYAKPFVSQSAFEVARQFLTGELPNEMNAVKIGVNLSVGSPARKWGVDQVTAGITQILAYRTDAHIILLTTPDEHDRAVQLKSILADRRIHVAPKLTLQEISALISQLDILLSPDTLLIHIARSFQVPVVGLYSRFMDNYKLWRPYGQESGVVVSNSENDILDITPEQVFDAFRLVLQTEKSVAR